MKTYSSLFDIQGYHMNFFGKLFNTGFNGKLHNIMHNHHGPREISFHIRQKNKTYRFTSTVSQPEGGFGFFNSESFENAFFVLNEITALAAAASRNYPGLQIYRHIPFEKDSDAEYYLLNHNKASSSEFWLNEKMQNVAHSMVSVREIFVNGTFALETTDDVNH